MLYSNYIKVDFSIQSGIEKIKRNILDPDLDTIRKH